MVKSVPRLFVWHYSVFSFVLVCFFKIVLQFCNYQKNKVVDSFYINEHNIVMWSFLSVKIHFNIDVSVFVCNSLSKAHNSKTACWNFQIFATYFRNTSFQCLVSFMLNNIIITILRHEKMEFGICTKFWTEAVVRYCGNGKLCHSYINRHKPIKCGHIVGIKLYFTIILTFIIIFIIIIMIIIMIIIIIFFSMMMMMMKMMMMMMIFIFLLLFLIILLLLLLLLL